MASIIKSDNGVSSGITGIVQSADSSGQLSLQTTTSSGTATTAVTIDNSQNVGVGVTPSAWSLGKAFEIGSAGNSIWSRTAIVEYLSGGYYNSGYKYGNTGNAVCSYQQNSGSHIWYNAPSGTAGNAITFTQAMSLDASGDLLVGTTSVLAGSAAKLQVAGTTNGAIIQSTSNGAETTAIWNTSTTSNCTFISFYTEASPTGRGSITYNRAGGLTVYNTTSDYRAKDISGPVSNSGALIDSVPVYMGKMKWATEERPMFIAHEVPAYAHTGEKDAVDADGNPVYQQMDATALVPVMWAEIQDLRKRLAALEATVETQATTIATLQNKIGA